jgi:DNA-binding CsgD family transcriptional regulator
LEVLGLICDGHSNREISEKLFISENTTRDHLKNIMRKMGVSSRSKIIAQVI